MSPAPPSWSRRLRSAAATVAIAALGTGCGVIFKVSRPGDTTVEGGRLAGGACETVETRKETDGVGWGAPDGRMIDVGGKTIGPAPAPGDPPTKQVLALACVDYTSSSNVAVHHYGLDPNAVDPMAVAVMLVDCGRSIHCLGAVRTDKPAAHEKYVAGLFAWYTAKVTAADVRALVSAAKAPEEAATVFIGEFETTRNDVMTIAGALEGVEKAVYLDIPFDARDTAVSVRETFAKDLDAIEALATAATKERASGVSDETVESLENLRRDHVRGCGKLDCMRDAVGHAIAKELFLAHISRGDVLGAIAELPMLPPGNVADAVAAQQSEAMRNHSAAADAVERGMKNGLDRDTATASTKGVVPFSFAKARPFDYEKLSPNWKRMVPPPPGRKQTMTKTYRLKRKKVEGAWTTLEWFDHVRTWDGEVCHDTNRIDRVDRGRVIYKQRCRKTGKKESMRTKHEPIRVPSSEAKALKTKDFVSMVVMTGAQWTGRVTWAKRDPDKPAVQVRGIRLR